MLALGRGLNHCAALMRVSLPQFLTVLLAWAGSLSAAEAPAPVPAAVAKPVERIYVIPVQDEIASPVLYIIRRGLKEAIEQKADAVILDMKTPGGALGTTLEIMEAIAKFPGVTITYVNDQAISAGSFIAASTDEIWFAPRGKIGAAAPVNGSGQDIDKTMRQKVVSYLRAEVRSISEGKGFRGQVISAMIDENFELKIGEDVLKPKGELLTLTATEAAKTYGDPPVALLSAGTAKDIGDLIAHRFGPAKPKMTTLAVTWSESLAVLINTKTISTLLLGFGILGLYIEFKTPGFGVFGIIGGACLAILFFGTYVAGLSGHEPMLVFGLGLVLLFVEIFFFPGIVVMALTGLALMLGSLVWAMADLWPNEPIAVAWSGDAFAGPMANLGYGMLLAVVLAVLLARFIPRGWVWDRMVVQSTVGGAAQIAGGSADAGENPAALVGRTGMAVTGLRPAGQIEIEGRRYEARSAVGAIERGRPIVVRSYTDFGLVVEETA
jgi:membrane-bound serine protease (ClpP class)